MGRSITQMTDYTLEIGTKFKAFGKNATSLSLLFSIICKQMFKQLHNVPLFRGIEAETLSLLVPLFKLVSYEKGEVILVEGDLLTLYTDGVIETQNKSEEQFGEQRLTDILRKNKDKEIRCIEKELFQYLESFAGGTQFEDDVTLIFIKRETKRAVKADQDEIVKGNRHE